MVLETIDNNTIHLIFTVSLSIYMFIGIICIFYYENIPPWYFAITLYFYFKWIFNYRKCTISYIECQLRGVKKKDGYLFRLLEYIVDFRYNPNIYYILMFQSFILLFYLKNKNSI